MNNKSKLILILTFISLITIGIVLYFNFLKKPVEVTSIEYRNTQYGFNFLLPISWKGYSIINTEWEGRPVDNGDTQNTQTIKGPEITIRHPLWTATELRQDIPIMIFTSAEWSSIQQEKLSLGAAPIGPSELGRSSKYIFALPARYNFAFPAGFEEVEKIIESKPLNTF